ncbi:DoxX family protein [Moheibacter sp.]|uniref:DoxX family protein n=1 Tax=Moheibacter sp. TaxID=1965316 RepID=UPI003C78A247
MEHLAEIFILIMLAIVFLQSGIDKIVDRKGNLSWLKGHFANSPLKNIVPFSLFTVTVFEIISGLSAVVGAVSLITCEGNLFALISGILSAITFLMLFLGQRLAKDYAGAQTIVIYLIPTVLLLYLLQA